MALPPSVQAALDAAEETLTAMNAPAATPVENPPAAEPPQPEPEQATPAPSTVPDVAPQVDPFETKYRVLQGKYNAEVPELHRRVRELESSLQAANERLDQVTKVQTQQPPQPLVDPKDAENFDGDLLDMVQRVAKGASLQTAQALEAKAKALEEQLASLKQQMSGVTQTTAMTAEQAFFDRVGKLVPNWEQINSDPAFLAWLAESDPVYGVPRQNALNVAQQQLNAERAAAVFNAFAGAAKTAQAAKADPLERMVSPKSAATVAPAQAQPQILTQAQVTQFYNELRQGKYKGNDAEAARIEAMINTALAEGRVR